MTHVKTHEKKDYSTLKTLLEKQETFPLDFTYKFIGLNSPEFLNSTQKLEKAFPVLRHQMTRKSANDKHIALTYGYKAASADEIIVVFQAIEKLADLLLIL